MKLGYIIIYVSDVEDTLAFYQAAFGLVLRFLAPDKTYGELETGSTILAFAADSLAEGQGLTYNRNSKAGKAAGMEIAFITNDVNSALEQALHHKAVLVKAPAQKPWGQTVAYVRDMNGVLIELCTSMST